MNAQELRIKNWCMRFDNSEFQISGIEISQMDNFQIELSPKPIKLTEEWLVKFGFVKIIHQINMNDGSMCEHWELNGNDNKWLLYFNSKSGVFAFNEGRIHYLYLNHNRYVHQLQNLYFALTGKELV